MHGVRRSLGTGLTLAATVLAAAVLAIRPTPAPADTVLQVPTVQVGAPSDDAAADAPSAQPLDATQPTSIVNRTALDRSVAPTGNYDDAIRLTPSVIDVTPNGPGLGEAQILTIRGFADGQYNVTFDGIPFADSDDFTHHSSAYFVGRDLASVTVDRGPGDATTIGDATFGGTVALRSISSGSGSPAAGASLSPMVSLGSYATHLGGVLIDSGRGGLPGGASALLDAETTQSNGALDGAAQRRGTIFGKLTVPLGPNATLTVVSNASRTVQNEPLGATRAEIAAAGPSTALNSDPRSQAYEGFNNSIYHTDISYAALSATLTADLTLSDTLYAYGLVRHFEQGLDPNGETPNGTALGSADVPGQFGRNGLRAWGDILRLVQTLPATLTLQAGLWIERQTNTRSLSEIDSSAGDVANPILTPVPGVPGSAAIDRLQHETLVTAQPYAQLAWQARSWLTLTAGLKGAIFDRDIDAPIMEGTRLPTSVDRTFAAALPSFTARARLATHWSVYAQAARGFLAPPLQFFDATDPQETSFSPAQTWNVQLGTSWRSNDLAAAADLYEILFDNAVGVRTIGGESLDFAEGSISYRGIEAEGTGRLGAGISLYASGSLNQADEEGGIGETGPAPTTPQATLSAGLLYDRDGINASLIDRWVGGSYGDVGGAQWITPYNQLDLSAGTVLHPRQTAPVRLQAQLFNLADSRKIDGLAGYTLAAGTPLFWTQAGRTLFVSATARF